MLQKHGWHDSCCKNMDVVIFHGLAMCDAKDSYYPRSTGGKILFNNVTRAGFSDKHTSE